MPQVSLSDSVTLYEKECLRARNLAPLTRKAYLGDLDELVAFLENRSGVRDVSRVRREDLGGFLLELDRRGLCRNYRRRKVAAIRSFFAFLQERGLIAKSPAR